MNRPIRVLFLDDDAPEILPDLKLSAKAHRVLIYKSYTNAKEGIQFLKKNHKKFDAIILDGFFLSEPGSSKKKNLDALKETVEELKKLLYRENLRIPHCVLTGYLEDISHDSLLSDIQVFRKGENNKIMFDYLKTEVAKNEVYQIKNEFDEIFELFDSNLLPDDKEQDLVEIIKKLRSKAKYNDDDAFNPIRKMYEVIVTELYEQTYSVNKHPDIVPDALFGGNDDLNITGSYYYLSGFDVKSGNEIFIRGRGKAVWPDHIANLVNLIVHITHQNSHDYPEHVHHYTYKSVVHALLELLLWYKEFITNYKKKHTDG
ncbi:MAG: hypothetical protein JJU13_02910 [Balneolaceae bacterium]|nr:hypothetical protein [Balneolaceae bacterium]